MKFELDDAGWFSAQSIYVNSADEITLQFIVNEVKKIVHGRVKQITNGIAKDTKLELQVLCKTDKREDFKWMEVTLFFQLDDVYEKFYRNGKFDEIAYHKEFSKIKPTIAKFANKTIYEDKTISDELELEDEETIDLTSKNVEDTKVEDDDKYTFKLDKRKNDYDEYVLKCYKNGKYYEDGTYYTDDFEDALNTMKFEAKRQGLNVRMVGANKYVADSKLKNIVEDETVNDSNSNLVFKKISRKIDELGQLTGLFIQETKTEHNDEAHKAAIKLNNMWADIFQYADKVVSYTVKDAISNNNVDDEMVNDTDYYSEYFKYLKYLPGTEISFTKEVTWDDGHFTKYKVYLLIEGYNNYFTEYKVKTGEAVIEHNLDKKTMDRVDYHNRTISSYSKWTMSTRELDKFIEHIKEEYKHPDRQLNAKTYNYKENFKKNPEYVKDSISDNNVEDESKVFIIGGVEYILSKDAYGHYKLDEKSTGDRVADFDSYQEAMNDIRKWLKQDRIDDSVDDSKVDDFFEPISSFKSWSYKDKTKQGFEVVKLYEDLRDNRLHAIVRRNNKDYVVGVGYSPDDGTWNQGYYDFESLAEAEEFLTSNYRVKRYIKDSKSNQKFQKVLKAIKLAKKK